ncbi:MAG: HAD family phosphatase [Akkermansia sp.]
MSHHQAHSLTPLPQAIIFDFDGLLVDTEGAIYNSWVRVFEQEGHPLPLHLFNQCLGSGYTHWNPADHLESLTGKSYDWQSINAERQENIHQDLARKGLLPGAIEILNFCRDELIPLAVASSSSHHWVDTWLEKLGIIDRFQSIVCRDDGYPVKPNPDLFLAAAKNIGIANHHCLVFEDSQNGTTAALKAGMRVIAIPNKITEQADFTQATFRLNSLHEALQLLKTE